MKIEMEEPTQCPHCKKIVELSEMWQSELWYENDLICNECHNEEESEMEEQYNPEED